MRVITSKSDANSGLPPSGLGVAAQSEGVISGAGSRVTVVVKRELSQKAKLSIYTSIYVPILTPAVMSFG